MVPDFLRRVFPGESQLAGRLRELDWSTNELGSPETWPEQLQAAIGLCLVSPLPMQVWWGPSLALLYNDASIRFLGDLHPRGIAHSGREWPVAASIGTSIGPALERVIADGRASWCEDVRLIADQVETFVTFSLTPIRDDTGGVGGVVSTLVDSTDGVIAKRRLDTLTALTVAASTTRSVDAACEAVVALLGKSDDIAFAALQLVEGGQAATHSELPDALAEAVATVLESDAVIVIAVDHELARQAIALPIHNPKGIAGVLVCGIIPHRPFDAVHQTFFELVAAQISAAIAEAQLPGSGEDIRVPAQAPAGRGSDAFLSVLAHELRNPLSALMTTVQALMLRAPSSEIELMERSVRHLSRVVDNLLAISRIAHGKLELQAKRGELAQIVDRAMELVNPVVVERKHQVFVRVPRIGLRLAVDPERIAQAIANVLSNAAKYSEPGTRISIEAARVDERVRLIVKDEGTGIEPERLASVFEAFYHPPETRPRSSGLGLGLAIARSLVELHAGTLALRSEGVGHGTECIIELPFDEQPLVQPRPSAPNVRKRVLLVEDNDDTARSLKGALEQLGYVVAVAHNAPIALNLARTFDPDVALLDIGLPVMDGWELARRLREQRVPARELPVVAVTAYDQESDKRRSEEAGFAEHLIKPIDLAKLEEVVESLPNRPPQQ